jgi:predicted DCC family thiol-disulfide oxidoreductase YuxK
MNTMKPMNQLTIFYDQKCGVCCQVKAWMQHQPAYVPLRFLAFDDPAALEVLPELPSLDPAGQIVVAADTGEVYRGADAWITCLWTLRNWRGWAKRCSRPEWKPLTHRLCSLISGNRLKLSELLRLTPESAAKLQSSQRECQGTCRLD